MSVTLEWFGTSDTDKKRYVFIKMKMKYKTVREFSTFNFWFPCQRGGMGVIKKGRKQKNKLKIK